MRRVIVFDVNETLLDLEPLRARLAERFDDPALAGMWFGRMLRWSLVETLAGEYHDFLELGRAALVQVAELRGTVLDGDEASALVDGIRSLPAHPDSEPGLALLHDAGFRLAALTNSPSEVAGRQLEHAGLAGRFDRILSVDAVGRFKPAPEVYQMAATELGTATAQLRLVAAHDWDVYGAMRAGCAGAFVRRPGALLHPLQPRPDIVGDTIEDVARQIIDAGG